MGSGKWMLYGANGYTGKLTAKLAEKRGHCPVLAGRNGKKIEALANELDLPFVVVDIANTAELEKALMDIELVLHMAGPFSYTSKPMLDACLNTGTHYLDITGEIPVIEAVFKRDKHALAAGVTLIPGVGFDVVPTDCLAAMLSAKMPEANELKLAFASGGGLSPGTTKTMIEGMSQSSGGAVRKDGQIIEVPAAYESMTVDFNGSSKNVVTIPWGDVSSAYYSTSIPNIKTYVGVPPSQIKAMKRSALLGPLLKIGLVKRFLQKVVDWKIKGPSDSQRARSKTELWGEVTTADGKAITATMTTPNGYSLTCDASIRAVEKVLSGKVENGAKTPSLAFGADFVLECDGVMFHGVK